MVSFIFRGNGEIPSLGDGPSQSIYQGALDLRVNGEVRWIGIQGGSYRTLDMSLPPNLVLPDAYLDFKTDGVMTALVMVQLLLEPYPVNPFLVYAAFFENDSCLDFLTRPYQDYLPDHLLAMIHDKQTRDLVAAVLKMTPQDVISLREPINNLLVERAMSIEIPGYLFQRVRHAGEHEGIVRPLLSLLLLGHHAPWTRRQFEGFRKGIRLGLCQVDDMLKVT
jgi:hypothetical protein